MFNQKLHTLRSFLERVGKSVDHDYISIIERADADEFENNDDLSNALYDPMQAEEIATRAIYHELNALIESELQYLAVTPLADRGARSAKVPRLVRDLRRGELWKLIGSYYQVQLDDLPGSAEVDNIRRIINAYKHRQGVKDLRSEIYPSMVIPEKHKLQREVVLVSIDQVKVFFHSLWNKIESKNKKDD